MAVGKAEKPVSLTVVRARPEDLDDVIELLEEVCAWLERRGLAYWPCGMLRRHPEIIGRRIQDQTVYLAYLEDELAGTITLRWDDEKVWGKRPNDSAYVAGLATKRHLAGRGLGAELLAWAEQQAWEHGRRYLRLDCTAKNPDLCQYYRDLGYRFCGERVLTEIDVRALFVKDLKPDSP